MAIKRKPWLLDENNNAPAASQQVIQKDTVGTPMATGHLYRTGGFWSFGSQEVISDIPLPQSKVLDWIPSRGVDFMESRVPHLSFVKPQDFTGSQSYMEYKASISADGECDYGPSADFNGFEYTHVGYKISGQSPTMTPQDWGARYYETQPIMRVRGPLAGETLENDAMWGLAQAEIALAQDMSWNIIYGDPTMGPHMFDGIDTIVQAGWVQSKVIGGGQAYFSDPLIESGVSLTTPQAILLKLKSMIRKIIHRMVIRGYTPTSNDMAVIMPSAIWTYLADSIAHGALMNPSVPSGWVINITPEGFFRERARVTSGFFGDGYIEVDSYKIPVLTDDVMGANALTSGGAAAVTSDIFVLTRFFRGMTVLEHQFFDWNRVQGYPHNGTERIRAGGAQRSGWKMTNNKCFQHYIEMHSRIVPMTMPFNGRLNDVTVTTQLANENESGTFTNQDWYPYNGAKGGAGTALVQGRVS